MSIQREQLRRARRSRKQRKLPSDKKKNPYDGVINALEDALSERRRIEGATAACIDEGPPTRRTAYEIQAMKEAKQQRWGF